MRDLHSHILPGIDKDITCIEDTLKVILYAKENGITDIMLTPYCKYNKEDNSYIMNDASIYKDVKVEAKKLGVNVYLGNEIDISNDLIKLYDEGVIKTLNDSKYMLVDIPNEVNFEDVKDKFYELLDHGITPILSHPENHISHFKDLDYFINLRTHGILILINYPSLFGRYGRKAKKMSKMLLKSNLVSFIGSDIHNTNEGKYELNKRTIRKIKKYVGEEKMLDITEKNFMKVVNNEDI